MHKKLFLYLKSVMLNGVKNPFRFLLSVSGLFLGIVLLSYAVFFLDSYYNGRMEEVEKMPKEAFLVKDLNLEMVKELQGNSNLYAFPREFSYTDSTTWFLHSGKFKGKNFHFNSTVVGTPAQERTTVYIGADGPHLKELSLLEGRLINNDDVSRKNRVAVIDRCVAQLLYPKESAIGKSVILYGDELTYTYEIIGVCETSYETKQTLDFAKSQLKSNIDSFFINSSVYVPRTVWETDFSQFSRYNLLLWTEVDNTEKLRYSNAVRNFFNTDYNDNIVDKESEERDIREQLSVYKSLFIIFFLVVFIFSGLNCMNIVFFSVKERISEIGIRKAYGASKESIIIQFMLETLLICFVSTFFGILVSLVLVIKTAPLLEEYLAINLVVQLKWELMMLPLLVAAFQGILFSIVPSIYASSIKIVDALRFE